MGENNHSSKNHKNRKWLKWFVPLAGWLPLLLLIVTYLTGNLGFNPVESVLRWTGRVAIIFLLLSLVPSPAHKIFVLPKIFRLRKPLGLYAALYAWVHFAVFAIWDYRLNFSLIWREILEKPFIVYGLIALIILILLAATSFRTSRRLLGKAWGWLHRLVYVAAILATLHYLLAIKGDLLSLQGAYAPPLIAAAVLIILLLLRIPGIHKPLRRLINQE